MREACEGRASARCKALANSLTVAQRVGGWGAAPLARSTPTRAQRGTRPTNSLKEYVKDIWF
ncbi:MAG: hypothetical protein NZ455_11020 [Bacteroidia bacterium]|nr:hypothetical protein [Bacteroidia bacterium]MDW8347016.1 hypothetical protein [Bacteroidia bacterium]